MLTTFILNSSDEELYSNMAIVKTITKLAAQYLESPFESKFKGMNYFLIEESVILWPIEAQSRIYNLLRPLTSDSTFIGFVKITSYGVYDKEVGK